MPRPEKVRLGEILLQQGLLTEPQLLEALAEQKKSGRKLGRVFVEKSFVSEEQISTALARQLQVPYINLKQFRVQARDCDAAAGNPGAPLPRHGAGGRRRFLPRRHGRPHRFVRLRRDRALPQARHPARGGDREPAAADDRPRLSTHRRDQRPRARARAGDRRRRHRFRGAGSDHGGRRCAGRALAADGVRRRGRRARLRHSHRAAGDAAHYPFSHRRRAARADRGGHEDRLGHGAAPEADVGPGYLGEALAAGRPLRRTRAQRASRRAYFHHADAVRRVGGDAFAESERRHSRTRSARHAAGDSDCACAMSCIARAA